MVDDERPTEAMLPLEKPDSVRATIAMPPLVGSELVAAIPDVDRVLAGYHVERELGRGSTGVVYAATHPLIGKQVAVKILSRELGIESLAVERFLFEARAVSTLVHENIVSAFDAGVLADGRRYLIMDLLVGELLRARVRRGALPLGEAVTIIDECAAALTAAHAVGIIHRDLKPDNVFLHVAAGRPPQTKLLDFGLAKLVNTANASSEHTRQGAIVGTPAYMSPEQARAMDTLDHRTDIYALGIMAFHLLAGRLPYAAESPLDMMIAHVDAEIPVLVDAAPSVPPELSALVGAMMAKQMVDRPSLAALRELLAGLPRAPLAPIEVPAPPQVVVVTPAPPRLPTPDPITQTELTDPLTPAPTIVQDPAVLESSGFGDATVLGEQPIMDSVPIDVPAEVPREAPERSATVRESDPDLDNDTLNATAIVPVPLMRAALEPEVAEVAVPPEPAPEPAAGDLHDDDFQSIMPIARAPQDSLELPQVMRSEIEDLGFDRAPTPLPVEPGPSVIVRPSLAMHPLARPPHELATVQLSPLVRPPAMFPPPVPHAPQVALLTTPIADRSPYETGAPTLVAARAQHLTIVIAVSLVIAVLLGLAIIFVL